MLQSCYRGCRGAGRCLWDSISTMRGGGAEALAAYSASASLRRGTADMTGPTEGRRGRPLRAVLLAALWWAASVCRVAAHLFEIRHARRGNSASHALIAWHVRRIHCRSKSSPPHLPPPSNRTFRLNLFVYILWAAVSVFMDPVAA